MNSKQVHNWVRSAPTYELQAMRDFLRDELDSRNLAKLRELTRVWKEGDYFTSPFYKKDGYIRQVDPQSHGIMTARFFYTRPPKNREWKTVYWPFVDKLEPLYLLHPQQRKDEGNV